MGDFQQLVTLALNLSPVDKVRLVEEVMSTLEQDLTHDTKKPKRSLYGLWTNISISSEDIDEVRASKWTDFPREGIA